MTVSNDIDLTQKSIEVETTPAIFRSDVTVELVDSMGTESTIVQSARVSTKGADSRGSDADKGLIRYLMKNQHGTPFESVILQWYFETPIFVDRQIMTHRLASTNGESGRYKKLEGVFYQFPENRLIAQEGKIGDYNFVEAPEGLLEALNWVNKSQAEAAWENYQKLKYYGVSNEAARVHFPTTLYVARYWTSNLRSTLNFIKLRKDWGEDADHQSKAQYEISLMVDKMAPVIEEKFPTVWEQFVKSGYRGV